MGYIDFNKAQLINLNFSLNRELLRTNRGGGYASSTIITTNTRKYHGLLVVPQPLIDDNKHVLLSGIGETLISHDLEFHLSMRLYQDDVQDPKGHKYLNKFKAAPTPKLEYRVGEMKISKDYIFSRKKDQILVKYNYDKGTEPVILRLRPFLAFRNFHALSKANTDVNTKYRNSKNGVSWQLYQGYSRLHFQLSRKNKYVHAPDWYYNIEYIREKERGYDYLEDLFVPGYFELTLRPGESVVVSAGLEEAEPRGFTAEFNREVKNRIPRKTFTSCLENAADEFIIYSGNKTAVTAGYPWFGRWGRDTFISLPGLTLARGDEKSFHAVNNNMLEEVKGGLFPNIGEGDHAAYNSVDAPLWFFWSMQQYQLFGGDPMKIWKMYGRQMKGILNGLRSGSKPLIRMDDNGLLYAGDKSMALTWMDAVVNSQPVTPRKGYAVEINALWYNAIRFCLELAEMSGDQNFITEWQDIPEKTKVSFQEMFWDKGLGLLADWVDGDVTSWDVRPNMIFAASLPYKMIDDVQSHVIVDRVKSELLTPKGLRTLSPKNTKYKGEYIGNQEQRDKAYHQGTAWPWLLGAYSEAYLLLHGKAGKDHIIKLIKGFEEEMFKAGIACVSEIFDGDPPHKPKGAISQAWSVAELLRMQWMNKHLVELTKFHDKTA